MVTDTGAYICDREIKTRVRDRMLAQWRGCRKPATIAGDSRAVEYLELHYCERHAKYAHNARPITL